jgi:hypothetical protein
VASIQGIVENTPIDSTFLTSMYASLMEEGTLEIKLSTDEKKLMKFLKMAGFSTFSYQDFIL